MGLYYCGPYAEQIVGEHEGYAARVLPGGQVTAVWSAQTESFTAYVAACVCGWEGGHYVPTGEGEAAAVAEWGREHLAALIAAARDGWSEWAVRTTSRAAEIAAYVAAERADAAAEVMHVLVADVAGWARVLEQVVEEAAVRGEW